MKRKSLEGEVCAVARALDCVGDWWSLLIVREALAGTRRFSDFQRRLGAARNILTTRLRTLVEQGVLEVVPASDGSAYREYAPTAKGRALFPVLVALAQWAHEWLFETGEPCSLLVDAKRGRPLRPIEIRTEDGRPATLEDVRLVRGEESA